MLNETASSGAQVCDPQRPLNQHQGSGGTGKPPCLALAAPLSSPPIVL